MQDGGENAWDPPQIHPVDYYGFSSFWEEDGYTFHFMESQSAYCLYLQNGLRFFKPFVPNAPFLYP